MSAHWPEENICHLAYRSVYMCEISLLRTLLENLKKKYSLTRANFSCAGSLAAHAVSLNRMRLASELQ